MEDEGLLGREAHAAISLTVAIKQLISHVIT